MSYEHYPEKSNVLFADDGSPYLDRGIGEKFLMEIYKSLYSDGVFARRINDFKVKSSSNAMYITVADGIGFANGRIIYNEISEEIELSPSSSTQDRTDYIILRYQKADRLVKLIVKENDNTLIRQGDTYEIGLAKILIPKNSSIILDGNITDLRLNSEHFGLCTPFYNIDIDSVFNQFDSYLQHSIEVWEEDKSQLDLWIAEYKTDWEVARQSIIDSATYIESMVFQRIEREYDNGAYRRGLTQTTNYFYDVDDNIITMNSRWKINATGDVQALSDTVYFYDSDQNITEMNTVFTTSNYEIEEGGLTVIFPDLTIEYRHKYFYDDDDNIIKTTWEVL